MAVYKVPQDVEAEDKLLGPFSFKQFVFILITIGTLYVAYLFFMLNPLLVVLPLPFSVFFGTLGLWPRKDQPVEVYLAAIIRFWIKPRKRIWNQEGQIELVQITAPKRDEHVYSDGLSRVEVHSRLKTLASTMDSRGWTSKNVGVDEMASYAPAQVSQADRLVIPQANTAPSIPDSYIPNSQDVMDPINNPVASHFDELTQQTHDNARQAALATMQAARDNTQTSPTLTPQPPQSYVQEYNDPTTNDDDDESPMYHAYPDAMRQAVITPDGDKSESVQIKEELPKIPTTTIDQSTAILNLANNSDLNVSTIAREAEKALHSDEVIQLH